MILKLRRKVIRAAITRVINRIKRGWTRNAVARTAGGASCKSDNPKAVKWCAVGALRVSVVDDVTRAMIRRAADRIVAERDGGRLIDFNDRATTKREHVIGVFEEIYELVGDNAYLKYLDNNSL